jgi:hypothetical protein
MRRRSRAERAGNKRKRSGDKKTARATVLGAVKARLRFHLDRACARWPTGQRRAAGRPSKKIDAPAGGVDHEAKGKAARRAPQACCNCGFIDLAVRVI